MSPTSIAVKPTLTVMVPACGNAYSPTTRRKRSSAAAAFERFRHVVGEYPFPQAGKITVSVGFTAIEVGDTPAAAFERADRAVYHAKHNGRDQVSNHAELMRKGIIEDDKRVSDVELF